MKVTPSTYRKDTLYPRVTRAVADLLKKGDVVAPVEVMVGMGLLRPEQIVDWRRGRVPCLERMVQGNLSRLSRILRILSYHARDRGLYPSTTVYCRWGKGPKTRLRFSKTGDPNLEEAWSRHFIRRRATGSAAGGKGPGEEVVKEGVRVDPVVRVPDKGRRVGREEQAEPAPGADDIPY